MAWWGKHKELSEDEVNLHALLLHSRFRAHKHRRPISRRLYRAINNRYQPITE